MNENDLTRRVARGALLGGAGHSLTQALSLATLLVLARVLTPHEIGEYAAGTIVAGAGLLLSESGMLAAVVRERERIEEAANTALVATVGGGLIASAAALAISPLVGWFFHSETIGLVSAALSGWIVIRQSMIVPDALLQRRLSFLRRVVVEPCNALTYGVVAVVAAVAGLGVWSLVLATYAGVSVQAILAWSLVRWRPRLRLASYAMWREMATRFGRPIIASEAIRLVQAETVTAIVGRLLGPSALGQYNYALRIARQPLMILINAAAYVLMPALSRISDDPERVRAASLRSLGWAAAAALPLSLALLPLGRPLVVALFGPQWEPAGKATAAMFAISAGGVVISVASETWKAIGSPHWLPRVHGLAAGMSVALTAVLAQVGLTAVGAAASVSAIVAGVFALFGMARALDTTIGRVAHRLLKPLVASLVMLAVIYPLVRAVQPEAHASLLGLILIFAVAAVGACVYLGALATLSPGEAIAVARTLRRRLSRPRGLNATKV